MKSPRSFPLRLSLAVILGPVVVALAWASVSIGEPAASHCTSGGLFPLPSDSASYNEDMGKYAVLICGGSGDCKPWFNNLSYMYVTLTRTYGYDPEDVFVLGYWGNPYDLDGDYVNDIDYAATRANIFAVFDTLDINRDVDENDVVFVYATDHGERTSGDKESYIGLINNEKFTASDLDKVLTSLEDEDVSNYWPNILAVIATCRSGGFVDSCSPYDKRAIVSACKGSEKAYFHKGDRGSEKDSAYPSTNYSGFSYWFTAALRGSHPEGDTTDADTNNDGYVSFKEAFKYAETHDEWAQPPAAETPQYFEYGRGFGSRITLDGVELSSDWAGLCRGHSDRSLAGGADAWGDGGMGRCLGSGIFTVDLGGPDSCPKPAPGQYPPGSRELYARVLNAASHPITNVQVRFYYGVPSTMASAADTSLHYIGTATYSVMATGDTALIGPVIFTSPGVNPFGQPYWKIFAVMEATESPLESGWVEDDFHTGIENFFQAESQTGEPVELTFRAPNPESEPKRMVLRLARNTLPEGWTLETTPALGETLEVAAGAELTVTAVVTPDGIHGPIGGITIEEDLCDPFPACSTYCVCDSIPELVTEGGFIRTTGGINFEVTAPYNPTAVTISGLSGFASAGGIRVSWSGYIEPGHLFRLLRKGPQEEEFSLVRVFGRNDSNSGMFEFLDRNVDPGSDYLYRVEYAGEDGKVEFSRLITAHAGRIVWQVSAGFPNPSQGQVSVSYSMPFESKVSVMVFDVSGRLVRRMDLGPRKPGAYTFVWDGKDTRGKDLPAGVYFLKLATEERIAVRKIALVR